MKKLPTIALGTWSWGTGFAGGDQVFGNNQYLQTLAMQHGMVWISLGEAAMQANGVNRLGSWAGAMAEAANDSPEVTPGEEDKLTAELLGKRVANLVLWF